ncbi:MAG: pentapeptide repeat-containing protein [Bacteroidota bacterium]
MIKKAANWIMANKIRFFFVAGILTLIGIIVLDLTYLDSDSKKDVVIEAHGMLFDIILFGIILSAYEYITSKNSKIEKYQDEIRDFLGWDEKEATYRIVGNIKRLNRLNVCRIYLFGAYLKGAKLGGTNLSGARLDIANLERASLANSNLRKTGLPSAKLNKASLSNADLTDAKIYHADLEGAYLTGANLTGADLERANLSGTRLKDANLERANLKEARNLTFEQLLEVKSLYQCEGLDPELEAKLIRAKPCLFMEKGCLKEEE